MDSFVVPIESTYLILARQGYAAQSRRQGGSRHSISPTAESFDIPGVDSNASDMSQSLGRRRTSPDNSRPLPIDMPSAGGNGESNRDSTMSSSYASSTVVSASPSTPCSPASRHFLHERYLPQLMSLAIEEEDDDDGVVIHNGLKRMSLSEQGILLQGRPRMVNI
ncbi:hypothetical protein LPJ53_001556 [Coemansia erecta]|uniref:Uncharacterized protein n=1 Tax=Coemansia erecta TaxID=147472 RepID=A0A9W7Y562_9FUNG|nr:hypothetical protein LPJ53_001556 [Coemansia erecta]